MNILRGKKVRVNNKRLARSKSFFTFVLCILILTISVGSSYYAVPVYASGGTIRGLIFSLVAMFGLTPTNQATLDAFNNNAFMNTPIESVADGTVSAAEIDQALNSMGVDATSVSDLLSNSATDAQNIANAAENAGWTGTVSQSAATAGENIASSAESFVNQGYLSPSLGGQALGVFNGTGALLPIFFDQQVTNENFQKMERLIAAGSNQNVPSDVANLITAGNGFTSFQAYDLNWFICGSNKNNQGYPSTCLVNTPSSKYILITPYPNGTMKRTRMSNGSTMDTTNLRNSYSNGTCYKQNSDYKNLYGSPVYNLSYDPGYSTNDLYKAIKNADATSLPSPDVIDKDGNATAYYDNDLNIYVSPNVNPILNYNTDGTTENNQQITNLINYNDYYNYGQTVNNNTVNNNYTENAQQFRNIINNMIDTVKPDTTPDIPVQPDKPTNPELTPEQEEQNKEMMLPPSLKDYFPFCIPFDIYTLFTKFNDIEREAPHLQFELDLQKAGKYQIEIDFSDYDDLASLLRLLELIGFIMLLMTSARKIIGD